MNTEDGCFTYAEVKQFSADTGLRIEIPWAAPATFLNSSELESKKRKKISLCWNALDAMLQYECDWKHFFR